MNETQRSGSRHTGVRRLSLWLFIYGICFAAFHVIPPLLHVEISHRFTVGDLVDFFTPFVLVLVVAKVYLLLRSEAEESVRKWVFVIMIVGGVAFIEGHGMHLSANVISRHLTQMTGTDLYALNYFFDERLGHILWDAGFVLFAMEFVVLALHSSFTTMKTNDTLIVVVGSVLYGFAYFVNAVEGQTVIFTIPFAVLIIPAILWLAKRRKVAVLGHPVLVFYLVAFIVAISFFMFWGIVKGGLPQFSELGWIC
jgi:hypothetical protein